MATTGDSPTPLDAAAWERRYQTGDTPWDHGEPAPGLVDFLATEPVTPGTALVPGCGAGHDCRLLARHGFRVTGLDFAAAALDRARSLGANGITYAPDDFLTHTGVYDWLVEHTCFCAIHPDQRAAYAQAAARCVRPGGWFLGVFFLIPAETGPPFGATRAELLERFAAEFDLLREQAPRSWPNRAGEEWLLWWRRKPMAQAA